jgi:UDP-N-acetyl-D-galactosamine dehydrogenase
LSPFPTPVDDAKRPDLSALISASRAAGTVLEPDDVAVYESTVYPGAIEEVCVPELEKTSGLIFNQDFFAGYSPERINPGDNSTASPTSSRSPQARRPKPPSWLMRFMPR